MTFTITPQALLMYGGIGAFVASAVLLGLTAYTFVHEDIRGVMDDLSGRRRATMVGMRASARRTARPVRPAMRASADTGGGAGGRDAGGSRGTGAGGVGSADDSCTAAAADGAVASSASRTSGALDTVVEGEPGEARLPFGRDSVQLGADDLLPTQVAVAPKGDSDAIETDAPTQEQAAPTAVTSAFRVTRRVISATPAEDIVGV